MKKELLFLLIAIAGIFYISQQKLHAQNANRNLSNLLSPTAINVDLLPDLRLTTPIRNLGSGTKAWNNLYMAGELWFDNTPFVRNKGSQNTFVGSYSGQATTGGAYNAALGQYALYKNTSGFSNLAAGAYALYNNTTGRYNTAVGTYALMGNTSAEHNLAIGYSALFANTTGSYNTAVGNYALRFNQTGKYNTAEGYASVASNTTGERNTAYGYYSLYRNTTGVQNTAQGFQALYNNNSGKNNTGIGYQSLYSNTSNSNNTAVGHSAGFNNTSASTFLGYYASSIANLSNCTAIGYTAFATASNQIRIGNTLITSIGGQVGWTTFSDGRYKKNLKEDVPGLEFINQLRPVTYFLDVETLEKKIQAYRSQKKNIGNSSLPQLSGDENPDPVKADPNDDHVPGQPVPEPSAEELASKDAKGKILYTGFVAQEVEQAARKINYEFSGVDVPKNENDFYGLRYADFVVPLVKAVQELSKENEELNQNNQAIEERIKRLEFLLIDKKSNYSSAHLEQNTPNPFSTTTIIRYYIPQASTAKVVITNTKGQTIKSYDLKNRGSGEVLISKGILAAGSYNYSLWIDGKQAETKQMVLTR